MPRENRKRGKKHKKKATDEFGVTTRGESELHKPTSDAPSWIHPSQDIDAEINPEAPFGYVDADVKAYFRTVDVQMRDWQETSASVLDQDADPNEERRLFFIAALQEMAGKEKQLATDPDCSVILERMTYSMDDFVRRVFVDSLTGSFEALVRHRFASHVCQTLFTIAGDTISREGRGVFSEKLESSDHGELRTLTQLICDLTEELLPSFSSLVMDPFASHALRALLVLLSPNLSSLGASVQPTLRSKKSAAWKAKQGPMKSVFANEKGKGKETQIPTPPQFQQLARQIVDVLRTELGGNETRALAANKAASPALQTLLEVEADQGLANDPNSLLDRVTAGIVTACDEAPNAFIEPSDYVNTLLRDPTSSHLLETIAKRLSDNAFNVLWAVYFSGKLARLAAHPVANFVVAKALERVSAIQLSEVCTELDGSWSKMIKTSRTGVLRALIDRSAVLETLEHDVCEVVYSAFGLMTPEDHNLLVLCALYMLPLQECKQFSSEKLESCAQHSQSKQGSAKQVATELVEHKIQGSILLQSLLRLPSPHNKIVVGNILSLPVEERIKIAHSASGSRIYDALLDSPTVTLKDKNQFVIGFLGYYHTLADDRLGSRVGDRCWDHADTYLKEKISRSLFSHEQFLAGSYYGKYFLKSLNLHLLRRRPDEWKALQASRKRPAVGHNESSMTSKTSMVDPTSATSEPTQRQRKRKRHSHPEDEIDAVFHASLGNRIKKASLGKGIGTAVARSEKGSQKTPSADELEDVLGAIKRAP